METRDTRTYYQILGVEEGATLDDIRKKFRKIAMDLHPDKQVTPVATSNPATQATTEEEAKPNQKEEEFKKVVEAYSCLSDPVKRREYDEEVMNGDSDVEERNYQYSRGNAGRFTLIRKREDILSNIHGAIAQKNSEWLTDIWRSCFNRVEVFNFILDEILSLDIDYGDFFVPFIRAVHKENSEGKYGRSLEVNVHRQCMGRDNDGGYRNGARPCHLHRAVKKRYQKLAEEMMRYSEDVFSHVLGWDFFLLDEEGNTTIQLAIKSKSDEIRDIYIEDYRIKMANEYSRDKHKTCERINHQNKDGESAFFAAMKHRCPWSVIEDLANFGGNSHLENTRGEKPIDLFITAVNEDLSSQITALDRCAQENKSKRKVFDSLIRLKNTTTPLYNKIIYDLHNNNMNIEKAAALLRVLSSYLAKVQDNSLDESAIAGLITSLARFETTLDWKTILGAFAGAIIGLVIAYNTAGLGLPMASATVNACLKTLAMSAIGAGAGFWKARCDDPVRHFRQDLLDHCAAIKNDI